MAQKRSKLTDLEIMLQNWLPVEAVTEEEVALPNSLSGSLEGCFSCGVLTHMTDQYQTLDYEPQLPVVGEGIPGPAVPCHVGTARLLKTMDRWTSVVGRDFRLPCSDSNKSSDDVVYAEGHDEEVRQISL